MENQPKYFSAVNCEISDVVSIYNNLDTRTIEEAEEIINGKINLLKSNPFIYKKKIIWNADPITKRKWRLFRGRPFLYAKEQYQDLKHVYELNRQQHLVLLAKAYYFSKDKKFEVKVYEQIYSWIKSNPYRRTVNWLSPLEMGVRIISWLWAYSFLTEDSCFCFKHHENIKKSIHKQTIYISNNLQRREFPNNHLIGEAATLVIVGAMFPHFAEAGNWVDVGLDILETQIERQVFSDGMDKEQALDYHRFVLDFYTHVVILCNRNNIAISANLLKKLESMYEVLLHIVRPDGYGPMIGDDDNGRVVKLNGDSGRYLLSALSTGAVLFERGDFKHAAMDFHEESFWLLGLGGYQKFQDMPSEKPDLNSFYFRKSGLFVMKSRGDIGSHYLSFDCGPQGMGTAGHGHSDGLSFELSVFGAPLMIDPGTFVYNGSKVWRDYFRGTSAHNTVVVDGVNQSEFKEPYDEFGWANKADCQTISTFLSNDFDFINAYHDGYKRFSDPVRHLRSMLFVKDHYWIITDTLDGQGSHCLEWPLHFVEGAKIVDSVKKGVYEIERGDGVGVVASFTCNADHEGVVFEGAHDPPQGWVSYRYGEKLPAPVLNIRVETSLPVIANTVLIPFKNQKPVVNIKPLISSNNDHVSGLEITINGEKDIYLTANGKKIGKTLGFETDAEIILARFDKKDILRECFAVNGSYFSLGGAEIFRKFKLEDFIVWKLIE